VLLLYQPAFGSKMGDVPKCDNQTVLYHECWAAMDAAAQLHADAEKMAVYLEKLVAGADSMDDMQQAGPWSAVAA
jgi:hypothetical protein